MLQFVCGPTVPFLDLPFGWSTEHSAVYLAAYTQDGLTTKPVLLMR